MSSDYSKFDRRPGRGDSTKRRASNGTLYLTLGGSAFLAALVGGLVVYEFMTPSAPPQEGSVTSLPAAPQAGSPAQPSSAQAPAATPATWTDVATYGAWHVRCQNGSAPKKICTAVLEVLDKQTKRVMMAWIIAPDAKGVLRTVFQTPTGVLVGSGIDVKFGSANTRHVNYVSCQTRLCTAAGPMDASFVKEATTNTKANVRLFTANGKSLDFGLPVNGLDKAIAQLKK